MSEVLAQIYSVSRRLGRYCIANVRGLWPLGCPFLAELAENQFADLVRQGSTCNVTSSGLLPIFFPPIVGSFIHYRVVRKNIRKKEKKIWNNFYCLFNLVTRFIIFKLSLFFKHKKYHFKGICSESLFIYFLFLTYLILLITHLKYQNK